MRQGDAKGYLAEHQQYSSVSATLAVGAPTALRYHIANGLPESAGITTRDFLCFFLFSLISLPAIWFPIHQMYVPSSRINCQITNVLLQKPTLVHVESYCSAHCRYHVLCVVHRQSPWNWVCCKAARPDPWFRSRLGNGLQSHVLHLQHGHACDVGSFILPA